jgi:hypothetical protein
VTPDVAATNQAVRDWILQTICDVLDIDRQHLGDPPDKPKPFVKLASKRTTKKSSTVLLKSIDDLHNALQTALLAEWNAQPNLYKDVSINTVVTPTQLTNISKFYDQNTYRNHGGS